MARPSYSALALLILFMVSIPVVCRAADTDGGKSIQILAGELAAKYAGRTPALWGETLPGIVTRLPLSSDGMRTVALTLDACGGRTDVRIIALLREQRIPATFFVTNRWLFRNRDIAVDLASDPLFALACHGARHKPASVNGRAVYGIPGTGDVAALVREVEGNAREVAALTGKRPRWYRSGTAFYDEVALAVIADLGLTAAGYTVAADSGATLPGHEVAKRLLSAPDGAIVLCHVNHPESGTYDGLAKAVPEMLNKGIRFIKLE